MEDYGRLRVMYMQLATLTGAGCPAIADGLDGDLARLHNDRAGRMAGSRMRGWVVAPSRCGELPRVLASAAAVRCLGRASGRPAGTAGSPRGRIAPAEPRAWLAPPGARRAERPNERPYRKVVTAHGPISLDQFDQHASPQLELGGSDLTASVAHLHSTPAIDPGCSDKMEECPSAT